MSPTSDTAGGDLAPTVHRTGYEEGDRFMALLSSLASMARSRAAELHPDMAGRLRATRLWQVLSTLCGWEDAATCARKATAPMLKRSARSAVGFDALLKAVRTRGDAVRLMLPVLEQAVAAAASLADDPDRMRMPRYLSYVCSRLVIGFMMPWRFPSIPVWTAFTRFSLSPTAMTALASRLRDDSAGVPAGYLSSLVSVPVFDGMERIAAHGRPPANPDAALFLSGRDPAEAIGTLERLEHAMRSAIPWTSEAASPDEAPQTLGMADMASLADSGIDPFHRTLIRPPSADLPLSLDTMALLAGSPPPEAAWRRMERILDGCGAGCEAVIGLDGMVAASARSDWSSPPDPEAAFRIIRSVVPDGGGIVPEGRRHACLDINIFMGPMARAVDEAATDLHDPTLIPAGAALRSLLARVRRPGRMSLTSGGLRAAIALIRWDLPERFVSESIDAALGSGWPEAGDGNPDGMSIHLFDCDCIERKIGPGGTWIRADIDVAFTWDDDDDREDDDGDRR